MGLCGFVVAVIAGLAVDNPFEDVLLRAVIAMILGHVAGAILGAAAEFAIADRLRQLRLAQETLTPSLAVFLDVTAGVRTIWSETVPLSPSEKLAEQCQRPIGLVGRAGQFVMQLGNVLTL